MDKKITVQYYANTKLKSRSIVKDGNLIELYPLYARIFYDTKNTQIKAEVNGETILVSESLSELKEKDLSRFTSQFESFIIEVIRNEILRLKESFSLTGLGKRLSNYSKNVKDVIFYSTIAEVDKAVAPKYNFLSAGAKTEKNGRLDFTGLARLIDPDLTVYEWLYGSGIEEFKKSIQTTDPEKVNDFIEIVNKLIRMKE